MSAVLAELSLPWITTRAAGTVALVASTGSILLGLGLAGRVGTGRRRGLLGDVRVIHQALGIATIVALLVHVLSLLWDPWLKPSLSQLAVPFTLGYSPVWTGLGIIAGYALIVAAVTGQLGRRLGRRWTIVHRSAAAVWVLSVLHTLGAGSDASSLWMQLIVGACVLSVAGLGVIRIRGRRPSVGGGRADVGRAAGARRATSPRADRQPASSPRPHGHSATTSDRQPAGQAAAGRPVVAPLDRGRPAGRRPAKRLLTDR